jgi:hypothetical protein
MGILIIFITTGCYQKNSPLKTTLTLHGQDGGNPEVHKIHQCLKLKNRAKAQCFNKLFPTKTYLVIHPNNGKALKLAGRGNSVEKRQISFNQNDEVFVMYIDTSNVKMPLSSNIESTKSSEEKGSLVLSIPVKDIGNKVTLKDKEGKLLLDYTIIN